MILCTGASGYLGRHVLAKLEARGVEYTATRGASCDLTDARSVDGLLRRVRPDVTIHCAAMVPKRPGDYQDREAAALSLAMLRELALHPVRGVLIFVSSLTAIRPESPYAFGKKLAEGWCALQPAIILRLPGLFGLPRRSGVIYEAALSGTIPDSFGPYPAMHVEDAAEYLVRAAISEMRWTEGGPCTVTYDDPTLQACYGTLAFTFAERVEQFRAQLQQEQTV